MWYNLKQLIYSVIFIALSSCHFQGLISMPHRLWQLIRLLQLYFQLTWLL
jgi:hypothetical protein